jgi:hypothetical protein
MKRKLVGKKILKRASLFFCLFLIGLTAGCTSPTSSGGSSVKFFQREAQTTLKMFCAREIAYFNKNGRYLDFALAASASKPNSFAELGITILPTARYTYTISCFHPSKAYDFTAMATCGDLDDDPSIDVWTINDNGTLLVTNDDSVN